MSRIRNQPRVTFSTPEERRAHELASKIAGIANPRERLDAKRDLLQRARSGDVVALIAADMMMGTAR